VLRPALLLKGAGASEASAEGVSAVVEEEAPEAGSVAVAEAAGADQTGSVMTLKRELQTIAVPVSVIMIEPGEMVLWYGIGISP